MPFIVSTVSKQVVAAATISAATATPSPPQAVVVEPFQVQVMETVCYEEPIQAFVGMNRIEASVMTCEERPRAQSIFTTDRPL